MADESSLLFIVGCPRSGTTWLQLMFQLHPAVRTGRETHLLDRYLKPLASAYEQEVRSLSNDGVKAYLSEAEFEKEFLRAPAQAVLRRLCAGLPKDGLAVEKTPAHIVHVGLLHRLFPGSKVLHIVRDPRAVFASWQAAAKQPWGSWARKDVTEFANTWLYHVLKRSDAMRLFGERYKEIRYEDLHASPSGTMTGLFGWTGLPSQPALETKINMLTLDTLRAASAKGDLTCFTLPVECEGFFRTGKIDAWRHELSQRQIETLILRCGEVMRVLGYNPE